MAGQTESDRIRRMMKDPSGTNAQSEPIMIDGMPWKDAVQNTEFMDGIHAEVAAQAEEDRLAAIQKERDEQPFEIPSMEMAEAMAAEMRGEGARDRIGASRYDAAEAALQRFYVANREEIDKKNAERTFDHSYGGQVLTDSIPTGNRHIDHPESSFVPNPFHGPDEPSLEFVSRPGFAFAPDSKEGITRDNAARGVDHRRSFTFNQNLKRAFAINHPQHQQQALQQAMQEQVASIPEGMPVIRLNANTGGWEYLRQVAEEDVDSGYEQAESLGKYRWTSADPSGITVGDLGKIFDAPEWGSVIGGVTGSLLTRNLTFFKNADEIAKITQTAGRGTRAVRGTAGAGGEFSAGMVGREIGNLIEIAAHKFGGGEITAEQGIELMKSDAGKEVVAMLFGRTGGRALDMFRSAIARKSASIAGLKVTPGSPESIAQMNAGIRATADDNLILNKQLADAGREERILTSHAEAEQGVKPSGKIDEPPSGQSDRVAAEQDRRANTGESNREISRDAANRQRVGQRLIAGEFAGEEGERASVNNLNRAYREGQQMRLSEVPDEPRRGRIHPSSLEDTGDGARRGLIFEINNTEAKVVSSGLPEGMQGVGLGTDMYRSFLNLSRAEGKTAASGSQLTSEADAVWRGLIDEGYPIERNPAAKAVFDLDGKTVVGYAVDDPTQSVYRMAAPAPMAEAILSAATRPGRKDPMTGRFTKGPGTTVDRVIHAPKADELASLKNELAGNNTLRADFMEQIWKNYDEYVNDGGYNALRREEWLNSADRTLSSVLTPAEKLAVSDGPPGAMREITEEILGRRETLDTAHGTFLTGSGKDALRNNASLLKQMEGMAPAARKRFWGVLDETAPDQAAAMRRSMMDDIADNAYRPVDARTVSRAKQGKFGQWLVDNDVMLRDAFDQTNPGYVDNLYRFNRSLARVATREGISGQRQVTNTPTLQMARTIMGVMNKWQRRITGARRIQMQKWYGRVIDIVGEPDKLQKLVSLQELQLRLGPGSRAVSQAAIRIGLADDEDDWLQMQKFANEWALTVAEDSRDEPQPKPTDFQLMGQRPQ